MLAETPLGRQRGMFSKKPPPVMWEMERTWTSSSSLSTGFT